MTAQQDRENASKRIASARNLFNKLIVECDDLPEPVQFFDIRVRSTDGAAVVGASIVVEGGADSGSTDEAGDLIVERPPGEWRISATKSWCLPKLAQLAATLPKLEVLVVELTLDELRYTLHVDADRDGIVDNAPQARNEHAIWQWGPEGRGPVVLCNNDCDTDVQDEAARVPDNRDAVINGNNDLADIALFEIRRSGPPGAPPVEEQWTATLEVLDGGHRQVRVFGTATANGRQIIGPVTDDVPEAAALVIALRVQGDAAASYAGNVFGMEALRFAGAGFDGLVTLRLTVRSANGETYFSEARFRVAPWIMPHHLDEARTVYVADLGADQGNGDVPDNNGNAAFRQALTAILQGADPPGGLHEVASPNGGEFNDKWLQDCMEFGYSVLPRESPGGARCNRLDSVLQTMRQTDPKDLKWVPRTLLAPGLGYIAAPGGKAAIAARIEQLRDAFIQQLGLELTPEQRDAVLRSLNASIRQWDSWDLKTVLDVVAANPFLEGVEVDMFVTMMAFEVQAYPRNPANEGGNLECTPPCRNEAGQTYPYGRIYFSPGAGPGRIGLDTAEFLRAQTVQAPFEVDATWLRLRHADEMMSFIPAPGQPYRQWRLLIASPERAYEIMDSLADNAATILTERHFDSRPVQARVADFRRGGIEVIRGPTGRAPWQPAANPKESISGMWTADQLRAYNLDRVQQRLDATVAALRNAIDLQDDQIIKVPIVFVPESLASDGNDYAFGEGRCNAAPLTGGLVNLVVVNGHCIMPRAFGAFSGGVDLFQQDVEQRIHGENPELEVHFINNWYPYHVGGGSLHCGTQVHRHPEDVQAWLASDAAKWWHFVPPGQS